MKDCKKSDNKIELTILILLDNLHGLCREDNTFLEMSPVISY